MEEEMITIPLTKYHQMLERLNWLFALESAGVDNWEGISYAYEIYNEGDAENEDV